MEHDDYLMIHLDHIENNYIDDDCVWCREIALYDEIAELRDIILGYENQLTSIGRRYPHIDLTEE